jgi:hypothetical protein
MGFTVSWGFGEPVRPGKVDMFSRKEVDLRQRIAGRAKKPSRHESGKYPYLMLDSHVTSDFTLYLASKLGGRDASNQRVCSSGKCHSPGTSIL